MDLFNPRANELAILKKHVNALRLLDIQLGEYKTIFSKGSVQPSNRADLFLERNFRIGECSIAPASIDIAESTKALIVDLYERTWLSHMIKIVNLPISLDLSPENYYDEIAKQVDDATFGRCVIVRLFDDLLTRIDRDYLRCVAIHDLFGGNRDISAFNLERGKSPAFDIYEEFYNKFLQDPSDVLVWHEKDSPELFRVGRELLDDVDLRTLVISALSIGGQLSGFLTVAYEIDIELTDNLRAAYANIANHSAAAIETYRKLNELHDLRSIKLREFIETFHLELIQGFRHVARNALFTAQGHYRAIASFYAFKGNAPDDPYPKLRTDLADLDLALANMASLRVLGQKKDLADIGDVFTEACELMNLQLEENGVTVKKTVKGHLVLPLNKDAVRYAFANMILNSVQALQDTPRRDKQISFNATRSSDSEIVIDLSDNGPGIRLGAGNIHTYEDIWVPGRTSKKRGTGYGLPMAREVFQRLHNGSIDLRPTSQGTTFRIRLHVEDES
jgi:signal transduction histidine kinase